MPENYEEMLIREYSEADLAALRAIHAAQGFDYALPDLRNPLFVTKLVLLDENVAPSFRAASVPLNDEAASRDAGLKPGATRERILGAAFLRLTAEAYLLLDPRNGTPRERWQWLLALHAAAHCENIRQTHRAPRLAPRRRLDALLQAAFGREVEEVNEVKEVKDLEQNRACESARWSSSSCPLPSLSP